jgi:hypothetical protein
LLIAYHFGARWQQATLLASCVVVTAAGNNAYTGVVSSEFFRDSTSDVLLEIDSGQPQMDLAGCFVFRNPCILCMIFSKWLPVTTKLRIRKTDYTSEPTSKSIILLL